MTPPETRAQWYRQQHGRDCPKVEHVGAGYLHDAADDRPYDVDGVSYCGRCHGWMGTEPVATPPRLLGRSQPEERWRAEQLWEELGGDLCICQRPDCPHWCESCQQKIDKITAALRGAPPANPVPEPLCPLCKGKGHNRWNTVCLCQYRAAEAADAGRPPTEPAMTPEKQFITPRPFHDDSPECPSCASLTAEIQQLKEQLEEVKQEWAECVAERNAAEAHLRTEHVVHADVQAAICGRAEAAERAQARLLDGLQQLGQQWRGLADAVPMTDFEQCADQLAAVVSASLIEKPVE